ncbi:MAG: histidine kinase [Mogibacterium sp.]|nr:histidine kinase [Mogibacterium sp.]
MSNWTTVVNFSIPVAGIMIVLFGMVTTAASSFSDKATRRFLLLFYTVLALYLASDILSLIAELYVGRSVLTAAAYFFEMLFSSAILPLLALYITIRCGKTSRSAVMYIVDIIWIGFLILLVQTQITTSIYYISVDNVFHRGPLYPVLMLPPALMMLVIFISLLLRRNQLTRKQFYGFLSYVIIPAIAMILHMKDFGYDFIALGITLAAGIMMVILLTDQADQAARQQHKIADQQASLMVLQMRPHFIYNTMMSIYYLVTEDPERAQNVILDFSTYLRKNFTAISREEPIPFEEELEHTRAYLAVEQVRFEDELYVEYDTPYTDFELPPLTLQPLVENSVKHGIDPELDPLTIYISTRKTGTGYDVVVADTGPGFGSSDSTAGNRVAMSNLRERLARYGNSLSVSDREGGGSVVTLHIRSDS